MTTFWAWLFYGSRGPSCAQQQPQDGPGQAMPEASAPPARPDPASKPKRAALLTAAIGALLAGVYANEGGYVNNPSDPGGATNYGVTEQVARRAGYTGSMRDFPMHCAAEASSRDGQPANQPVSVCADQIYVRDYIEKPGYMPLIPIEPAVADELVDTTVNMGSGRPSRWFQESINQLAGTHLAADGKVGPATIAGYQVLQAKRGKVQACVLVLDALDSRQRQEYGRLVARNPKLKVFYKGWISHRIGNVDRADCGKGWE